MATNNAINSNIPIEVTKGGTAATTLLDHGVLVGSGTSPITALTVGTTGQLLVGASSADPAFASSSDGDFTFTSATANITRTLTVENTDNTGAATSAARVALSVGGANVADADISYTVTSSQTWTQGIDNSASDSYTIAASSALGTTNTYVISTDGEVNLPLTSSARSYLNGTDNNVTGDGTTYTVQLNAEEFDQNSNFSTTTFTAPVTATYYVGSNISVGAVSSSMTSGLMSIVTSNRQYDIYFDPATYANVIKNMTIALAPMVDMDASDTLTYQITVSGGTKIVDTLGGSITNTNMTIYLAS